jgi:hypothetical protein
MSIEWTTVISSGVVAAIISSCQFVTTRYLGRFLDRIEKDVRPKGRGKDKGKGGK